MQSAEPCDLLEWDSEFWGIRIGRVVADVLTTEHSTAIDRWALAHHADCLYFLARADSSQTIRVAQEAGFRLVDIRVELARQVSAAEPTTHVRDYRDGDLPSLRQIARTSYTTTRFYADPGFARDRCNDFYDLWIERSCDGWADGVLVANLDDGPVGYVTFHLGSAPGHASIGLIGVSAELRGQGLGEELMRGALSWAHERRMAQLSVVTQGANIAGQRLFQRSGFRTRSVGLWFHKWYRR